MRGRYFARVYVAGAEKGEMLGPEADHPHV